jgi:hypothetical protein
MFHRLKRALSGIQGQARELLDIYHQGEYNKGPRRGAKDC